MHGREGEARELSAEERRLHFDEDSANDALDLAAGRDEGVSLGDVLFGTPENDAAPPVQPDEWQPGRGLSPGSGPRATVPKGKLGEDEDAAFDALNSREQAAMRELHAHTADAPSPRAARARGEPAAGARVASDARAPADSVAHAARSGGAPAGAWPASGARAAGDDAARGGAGAAAGARVASDARAPAGDAARGGAGAAAGTRQAGARDVADRAAQPVVGRAGGPAASDARTAADRAAQPARGGAAAGAQLPASDPRAAADQPAQSTDPTRPRPAARIDSGNFFAPDQTEEEQAAARELIFSRGQKWAREQAARDRIATQAGPSRAEPRDRAERAPPVPAAQGGTPQGGTAATGGRQYGGAPPREPQVGAAFGGGPRAAAQGAAVGSPAAGAPRDAAREPQAGRGAKPQPHHVAAKLVEERAARTKADPRRDPTLPHDVPGPLQQAELRKTREAPENFRQQAVRPPNANDPRARAAVQRGGAAAAREGQAAVPPGAARMRAPQVTADAPASAVARAPHNKKTGESSSAVGAQRRRPSHAEVNDEPSPSSTPRARQNRSSSSSNAAVAGQRGAAQGRDSRVDEAPGSGLPRTPKGRGSGGSDPALAAQRATAQGRDSRVDDVPASGLPRASKSRGSGDSGSALAAQRAAAHGRDSRVDDVPASGLPRASKGRGSGDSDPALAAQRAAARESLTGGAASDARTPGRARVDASDPRATIPEGRRFANQPRVPSPQPRELPSQHGKSSPALGSDPHRTLEPRTPSERTPRAASPEPGRTPNRADDARATIPEGRRLAHQPDAATVPPSAIPGRKFPSQAGSQSSTAYSQRSGEAHSTRVPISRAPGNPNAGRSQRAAAPASGPASSPGRISAPGEAPGSKTGVGGAGHGASAKAFGVSRSDAAAKPAAGSPRSNRAAAHGGVASQRFGAAPSGSPQRPSIPSDVPLLYCEIDRLAVEIQAEDLTPAGLFVQTPSPPAADSEVAVFLRVGAREIEASGHVVQSVPLEVARRERRRPGFGLLFTSIDEATRTALREALEALNAQPKFDEDDYDFCRPPTNPDIDLEAARREATARAALSGAGAAGAGTRGPDAAAPSGAVASAPKQSPSNPTRAASIQPVRGRSGEPTAPPRSNEPAPKPRSNEPAPKPRSNEPAAVTGSNEPAADPSSNRPARSKEPALRDSGEQQQPSAAASADPRERELLVKLQAELAQLQTQPPWTVLGISQGADEATARKAFHEASKRYHPHSFARYAMPEIKAVVTQLFIIYKRAFTAMTKTGRGGRNGAPAAGSGNPPVRSSDPGNR